MKIPLSQPDITEREVEAVVSVLRSSRLSLGPAMGNFEHRVAQYAGVAHGAAVSSGTAGLHLCLLAMGIGEGDEVIVPSFTFIAAANAIRYVRATPVFVDVESRTLNMNPDRVEEAITSRTRAIMVVHTFGLPAQVNQLLAIAQKHSLRVIEDACEAIGAEYKGKRVGSFGDAAVFAFYPNKQITTGEGGVVVTDDAELIREVRALRNQGRYDSDDWLQHSILGYNYRLSEINAALGVAQMQRIEEILERRTQVAEGYRTRLSGQSGLVLPVGLGTPNRNSWFVYVVRLPPEFRREQRDQIFRKMQEKGIQCGRYFAPIHTQPAYAGMEVRHALPVTERESERTLALPFFTRLAVGEIEEVCRRLVEAIEVVGRLRPA